jgi:hypothetical protein
MKYLKHRANFKFNNGRGALLCSSCRVIIKTGVQFSDKETNAMLEKAYLEPQYCENCKQSEIMKNVTTQKEFTLYLENGDEDYTLNVEKVTVYYPGKDYMSDGDVGYPDEYEVKYYYDLDNVPSWITENLVESELEKRNL